MNTIISSKQNPRIKQLLLLQQKSSERRRTGLFVVEGQRELSHCLEAGYEVEELYLCPDLCDPSTLRSTPCEFLEVSSDEVERTLEELSTAKYPPPNRRELERGFSTFNVTPAVYEHIAYRGSTEGIMAVVRARHLTLASLDTLFSSPNALQIPRHHGALIIVLESVEKPGNLGAILRSADAAGADAVIVCDPLTDLYNPNLIRASIGAIFTVPTVACTSAECITFLRERGIQILTAQLQDSHPYYDIDMRRPTAIVMGTEATGLTEQWRQAATAHIRIPMLGRLDSLNVSVSSAILLYEAVRQRMSN